MREPEAAVAGAEFVQENAPEREEREDAAAAPDRRRAAARDRHRVELVGPLDEPPADRLPRIPSAASSAIRSTRRI